MDAFDEDDNPPPTNWLITYADLMSLLLAVFVLLVAVSPESPGPAPAKEPADAAKIAAAAEPLVRDGRRTSEFVLLNFEEGRGELSEADRQLLQQTADTAGRSTGIELRGRIQPHPLPPDSPYRSSWDLAYARCFQALEFLVRLGVDPHRVRIDISSGEAWSRRQGCQVEVVLDPDATALTAHRNPGDNGPR